MSLKHKEQTYIFSATHLLTSPFLGWAHVLISLSTSEPQELSWHYFQGRNVVCTTLFRCTLLERRGALLESRFYDQHDMSEWVIKIYRPFSDRRHRGPYSPYKPCNHTPYIGIIIFSNTSSPGLAPDISKLESWTHVGRTANIIIKDIAHIFASICKNMHILLMGRRYRERCSLMMIWLIGQSWPFSVNKSYYYYSNIYNTQSTGYN